MLELTEGLLLDLKINTSERQCLEVNELLILQNQFLRVYELKKKIRYLLNNVSRKNNVKRELSSCLVERFSVCEVVRSMQF